ncbi:MAG TPA: D-glycerate dehydrogenase [Candidatus Paceibacterota bacterium]
MNIFVTRKVPQVAFDMLAAKGYTVDLGSFDIPPTKAELVQYLNDAAQKGIRYDALLTLLTDQVDGELLDAAGPQLKIVSNYAVGYNNIVLADAAAKNVQVTNTPGNFSDTIAEHTAALILALTTRIVEADKFVRNGGYKGWDPMIFIGTDLSPKTIGILGAGRIGERVAMHLGKGFGMPVLYYDIKRNDVLEKEYGAVFCETPEEVISKADIVSLHVPLLPTTHHLMNAERFALMKPGSYLINTARGPVVEEAALIDALKSGKIAGAGLDVFEFEPKVGEELLKMDNVVLTPHIASARKSARDEMATLAAQNIIDVFEGREPKGAVKTL